MTIRVNLVMSTSEYNLLENLAKAFEAVNKAIGESSGDSDLGYIYGTEMDFDDGDNCANDIRCNDIVSLINRYQKGELKDSAVITLSNNMGLTIIEVSEAQVFGYYYENEEKIFFVSEVAEKLNEDKEEDEETEYIFFIGDGMFDLKEAMRINN